MDLIKIYNADRVSNSISITLLTTLLFIVLLSGCKVPQIATQRPLPSVPETFAGSADTTNLAQIQWRDYFQDSTLINLIETALANNLDALTALQCIEMARANVRATEGFLRPTVLGGGAASLRKFGLYTMDGSGNATTDITEGRLIPVNLPDLFMGLTASWEVDIWKKLRSQREAALARYLSSVEAKNWVTTNIVADVSLAYYDLLSLDNELDIVRQTITLQEDALKIVTVQKQAAAANELAVEQFEAQLLNSRNLEIELLQTISETENFINLLLGRFPQPILRDKSHFIRPFPAQLRGGLPLDLLKNRPDIRAAELELLATKADLVAARAAFYPSLNLTGSLGFQAFSPKFLFTTPQSLAYSLIGNLTAPLINRAGIEAQFKGAQAVQIEALYNYQKTILSSYIEVNNQLSNLNNLVKMYDLKTRETAVLTRSIETSNKLYRTGRATYLEVLFAQQNALQGQLALINTQKRQLQATVNLYRALGGGWK
ncbi:efflux transporter outer membrane subunit [Runella sp.]|jgi:outer membrane protein, multidrug efflux system|uniref:efflux transporter outer membrane subunit n=1 Tax=Runella sp. TaxID=1960881 RepID=UPI0030196755